MGRRPRPPRARRGLAALLALALLAGCANTSWRASSGGPPPPGGATATVQGSTGVSALLFLGILTGTAYGPSGRGAPMDPDRRVVEQDCTRPLQDTTGNLRCK